MLRREIVSMIGAMLHRFVTGGGNVVYLNLVAWRVAEALEVRGKRWNSPPMLTQMLTPIADARLRKRLFLFRGSLTWEACTRSKDECVERIISVLSRDIEMSYEKGPALLTAHTPIVRTFDPVPEVDIDERRIQMGGKVLLVYEKGKKPPPIQLRQIILRHVAKTFKASLVTKPTH